jgi:hypothetical protein
MFGELKTYIKEVWDEHIGFVKADFLGFLEECVTVVGVTAQIPELGNPSRLPNYENSKLKRRERKSRSAHDFGDTNTRSLKVTLSEVTCPTCPTRP